ncbi:N-acetylmuramoyl-L-alanine amidase [Saccharopolyspora shandongensis]|uniref:N-acetylmuramoyl-L-alanine amidase n=1 Tax=Saccharopolyspora shandongensis TaxID=418495 RepID=A0A1H3TLB7_9PSEU|nr:N-acetylmuramoyl-L-alanine amidase [Saccharopolyspora shandongensis]SDZ51054.1 N-acetylmuramoyl-L-alanine amidase [Saccharopolyspora shandongensis]
MALPLVWLADVLRAAGLRVVETPGWRERTASGPQPRPVGVLEHHTATPTSYTRPAPTVQMCIDGRPDLDGPLCHAVIAYDGTVHLIAAGRANHAGKARASGPNPAGDGNTLYVGFEWDYHGVNQSPSPEQYDAAVRATRAVLAKLGRPADAARGHRETSVTGKIDPGHVDLDQFRRDVAAANHQEDDLTPEQAAQLSRIENELLGPRGDRGQIQGWGTDNGPRTVVAMLVDIYNGLLSEQPSRYPGSKVKVSAVNAIRDNNGLVYQLPAMINAAGQSDPAKVAAALRPVLAEVVGPVVRESVKAALGEDNAAQADAIVDQIADRLAGPGRASAL